MHLTNLARKFSTKRPNKAPPLPYKISSPIHPDLNDGSSHSKSVSPSDSDTRPLIPQPTQLQGRGPLSPKMISEGIIRKISHVIPKRGQVSDLPTTCLRPVHIHALTHDILGQSVETPLLTTKIAGMGSPLTRTADTAWSKDLCNVHTWLNMEWLNQLRGLVGNEIGPHLRKMWALPQEYLNEETERYLYEILWPYRILATVNADTPVPGANYDVGRYYDGSEQPEDCEEGSCVACNLSMLFQNANAVEALALCAKSRKRRNRGWPQILAWLEPIDERKDRRWRRRWLIEGKTIRADRRKARMWKERGGMLADSASDIGVKQEFEKAIHRAFQEEHALEEEELDRAIAEEQLIADYCEESRNSDEETELKTDSTRPMLPEDFLISECGNPFADDELYRPMFNTTQQFEPRIDEETGEVIRGVFDKYQSIVCSQEHHSGNLMGEDDEKPQPKAQVAQARATAYQDLHQRRATPSFADYVRWQRDNPRITGKHGRGLPVDMKYHLIA